jgi:drug/metabolite transporter (DMT)-like permease
MQASREQTYVLRRCRSDSRAGGIPTLSTDRPLRSIGGAIYRSGTLCLLIAAAAFAAAAALVKSLGGRVPVLEIVLIRSAITCSSSYAAAYTAEVRPLLGEIQHWPLLALRGLTGEQSSV